MTSAWMLDTGKVIPVLAEQSIAGALLVYPDIGLSTIRGKISPSDFADGRNRTIYLAACSLADGGETVDAVTIKRRARELGTDLENDYLVELMGLTATAANLESDCRELAIDSSRRILDDRVREAITRNECGEPTHEVCAWLRAEMDELCERTATGGVLTSSQALLDFKDYRERMERAEVRATVATGYRRLDDLLGGGMANEGFYVLAARPGNGKTTFALNIAEQVTTRGDAVLFVSLEMSEKQLAAKRLAIETGYSSTLLLNEPHLGQEVFNKVVMASAAISTRPLVFNRAKTASVDDIAALASKVKGLKLVIIDYLGLIRHTEGRSPYEKITATSGALKRLARSLGTPVLCLAQLNREVEGRSNGEPRISDLRDSGAIEQDADGIILLRKYDPPEDNSVMPSSLHVILGKNCHAGTGSLDLNWYLVNGRIRP